MQRYGNGKLVVYLLTTNQLGQPITLVSNHGALIDYSDQRSSVRNPVWRRQIAARQNAGTPFSGFTARLDPGIASGGGMCQVTRPWWVAGGVCIPFDSLSPLHSSALARVDTLASVAVRNKLKKAEQSFAGGVFIGELKETIQALRNPLRGLLKHTEAYLKAAKKLSKGRHVAAALRSEYLAFTYGWAPLSSDVDSAVHLLDQKVRNMTIISGSAHDEMKIPLTRYQYGNAGGFPGRLSLHVDYWALVKTRVRYQCGLGTDDPSTAMRLGFAPEDFVPTLWELLPFSFVVDYFTNIGDVISACSTGLNNARYWNRTRRQESWVHMDLGYTSDYVPYTGEVGGSSVLYVKRVWRDQVEPGRPWSGFRWTLPNIRQGINVAALAPELWSLVKAAGRKLPQFL